jgi:hypothetical protein
MLTRAWMLTRAVFMEAPECCKCASKLRNSQVVGHYSVGKREEAVVNATGISLCTYWSNVQIWIGMIFVWFYSHAFLLCVGGMTGVWTWGSALAKASTTWATPCLFCSSYFGDRGGGVGECGGVGLMNYLCTMASNLHPPKLSSPSN